MYVKEGFSFCTKKYYKKHTHIDLCAQINMGMFFGVESLRNHRIKNFFRKIRMAKLSLTEVSKRFKVSRSTVYRAIKEGKLSRSADNQFDLAEVIRCFGEPVIKASPDDQSKAPVKDDADLRQLVDFMKREIESYKEREQRYLDQIDRFQLLLGHKESSEKVSHDTPVVRSNDTPSDTLNNIPETIATQVMKQNETSHDTSLTHLNGAPRDTSKTSHDTLKKQPKKRGLFGRVISSVFNDN